MPTRSKGRQNTVIVALNTCFKCSLIKCGCFPPVSMLFYVLSSIFIVYFCTYRKIITQCKSSRHKPTIQGCTPGGLLPCDLHFPEAVVEPMLISDFDM